MKIDHQYPNNPMWLSIFPYMKTIKIPTIFNGSVNIYIYANIVMDPMGVFEKIYRSSQWILSGYFCCPSRDRRVPMSATQVASLEVLLLVFCPWATIKTPRRFQKKSWLVNRCLQWSWMFMACYNSCPVKLGSTIPFYTANNPGSWLVTARAVAFWRHEPLTKWRQDWKMIYNLRSCNYISGGHIFNFCTKNIDSKSGSIGPCSSYALCERSLGVV